MPLTEQFGQRATTVATSKELLRLSCFSTVTAYRYRYGAGNYCPQKLLMLLVENEKQLKLKQELILIVTSDFLVPILFQFYLELHNSIVILINYIITFSFWEL